MDGFGDVEVLRVVDRRLGAERALLLEVLLDVRVACIRRGGAVATVKRKFWRERLQLTLQFRHVIDVPSAGITRRFVDDGCASILDIRRAAK